MPPAMRRRPSTVRAPGGTRRRITTSARRIRPRACRQRRRSRFSLSASGRIRLSCSMAKKPLQDAPEVEVASRAELRAWLAANQDRPSGVWLVSYKKSDPGRYLSYDEIVEECLCFGWVDSLSRGKDAARSMLWIAPRKPGSNWSASNKTRVARLEAAGLMTDAGRRPIALAKAEGGWTRLDAVEALEVPGDLGQAFDAHPGARAHWDGFPRSVRRGILEWILNAKRPETRAARVAETALKAARGERANQWRG